MKDFLAALHTEIELSADRSENMRAETIFLGGGTPSLLTPEELSGILGHLRTVFQVSRDAEVTVEANPETVDLPKLKGYRDAGVNRLSIGIQSFNDMELEFLGRIHDSGKAEKAFRLAREAGFENVNVDLIYSLPGQTLDRWAETLARTIGLGPDHISAYSLIVEDNTPLARMVRARQVSPAPPEIEAEMFEFTMETLAVNGFEHYEISNFARPGYRSRHNFNYWRHGDYLGFGPSAHSFRKRDGSGGTRWWNVANISTYIKQLMTGKLPVASTESLSTDSLMTEHLFLGLRSTGLDLGEFRREFGDSLVARHATLIQGLVDANIATVVSDVLRLTPRGYLICDEVSARLVS